MQIIKRKVYFKLNNSLKEKFSNFFYELTYIEFCLRTKKSIVLRKKAAINTNI